METQNPVRPTFLTVLCVLTFLASGMSILSSGIGMFSGDTSATEQEQFEEAMDELDELQEDNPVIDYFKVLIESLMSNSNPATKKKAGLMSLISSLLTFAGAIAMWNLRKVGYYAYVVGIALYAVSPWLVYTGEMAAMAGIFSAFIGLLFFVLYTANLKHLN